MKEVGQFKGVIAIVLGLGCAIGIHLEECLRIDLASVIVIPAHVHHPAIVKHSGKQCVHLIEADTSGLLSILVTVVEIADVLSGTVNRLNHACRIKHDIAIECACPANETNWTHRNDAVSSRER